ncbi:shikimate dehydrogenase family protein [Pontibacter cellulosilyticus]|uniref:Shikimate dehydrogenase n=1 Tax=Pontibacter cellulosilyticus TaxID=1720253 RepID=A0A923N640_9BACT|nr:shikimate dehydrogenase [Pontibacter cellulosilyticus]MBC5992869.1 shikimate dehydrogenase [Pontibacter cellulosilyticus]
MRKFGLIGKKLGHSFSKKYFTAKFEGEGIADAQYNLYELEQVQDLKALLQREPELVGLNVTIPYKQEVIPLLDELDDAAARIGAVNTIKIENGHTKGYNTDYIGFKDTLQAFYPKEKYKNALVLGTGGASKAICTALSDLSIPFTSVSRTPAQGELSYEQLTEEMLQDYNLIVNTTPLGMAPNTDTLPTIPYESISTDHFAYDIVYNPEKTLFLERCEAAGAKIMNGIGMLHGQAEAAWDIWNS